MKNIVLLRIYLPSLLTTERKLCNHQSHSFQLFCMGDTALRSVDVDGIDIAVVQNVCQSREGLFQRIKSTVCPVLTRTDGTFYVMGNAFLAVNI